MRYRVKNGVAGGGGKEITIVKTVGRIHHVRLVEKHSSPDRNIYRYLDNEIEEIKEEDRDH